MPSPALSPRWLQQRHAHWTRLEALLAACGRQGVRALNHRELRELALLYRQTAADLSTARADPASASLAAYLNALLGRAHNHLYTAKAGGRRAAVRFFTHQFPRAFRETWPYTAAATAVFAAGVVIGLLLCVADPGFDRFILGGEMMDTIDRREMWTHSIVAIKPLAATGIMTNNLSVAFTACATGMLAGLGTFYMMLFNGLLMGVVSLACLRGGLGLSLFSFVAPHGALELPAIFIAGGAGFILARGVLVPGLLPRRDAMAQAGAQAIRLLLGVIPLLVIAGLIEGFVSPTDMAPTLKFLLGAGIFVLLALYLGAAGRRDPSGSSAPADGGRLAVR